MGPFRALRRLQLTFSIVFNHPAIDKSAQKAEIDLPSSPTSVKCRAPDFRFMQEVEYLRENGLALGGGLENASCSTSFAC
jgi:UDP-3-O-[3-hydroxymyristoyl] N-acetylglucosamine deacetylase